MQRYFALYPDGLRHACEQELRALGGRWVCEFPEQSGAVIDLHADAPLPGTFSLLFRTFAAGGTVAGSVLTGQTLSADALDGLVAQLVSANTAEIAAYLGTAEPWRITALRAPVSHDFQSQEVERSVGKALRQHFDVDSLPPVSLVHYTRELRVWVGDGILVLGFSPDRKHCSNLSVEKGEVLSRADDAVSVCIAWIGVSHALALRGPVLDRWSACPAGYEEANASGQAREPSTPLHVLDPMCGVGTYLFAAAKVAQDLNIAMRLRGRDQSAQSIDMARQNAASFDRRSAAAGRDENSSGEKAGDVARGAEEEAGRAGEGDGEGGVGEAAAPCDRLSVLPWCRFDFSTCDCVEEAPCEDGWAELVMVDPPWGQRHRFVGVRECLLARESHICE